MKNNVDHWLQRPMSETERVEITRRAQENAKFHIFNCLCERCSDKRRALCDPPSTPMSQAAQEALYWVAVGVAYLAADLLLAAVAIWVVSR